MSVKKAPYIIFKTIVTVVLIFMGFHGILGAAGLSPQFGAVGFPLLEMWTLGIFINSCLFLAMAVGHNFNPVSKLLKTSLLTFGLLIFPPMLFCFVIVLSKGSLSFLFPFLMVGALSLIPLGLIYLSNKSTLKHRAVSL